MIAFRRLLSQPLRNFAKRYSAEHEWVDITDDRKKCAIGISDYAQIALGQIVHLELPTVGQKFNANESMGIIESPKAVSQIFAPIDLVVTEVNSKITNHLNQINEHAEQTWLFMCKPEKPNASDFDQLMTPEQYQAFIKK